MARAVTSTSVPAPSVLSGGRHVHRHRDRSAGTGTGTRSGAAARAGRRQYRLVVLRAGAGEHEDGREQASWAAAGALHWATTGGQIRSPPLVQQSTKPSWAMLQSLPVLAGGDVYGQAATFAMRQPAQTETG